MQKFLTGLSVAPRRTADPGDNSHPANTMGPHGRGRVCVAQIWLKHSVPLPTTMAGTKRPHPLAEEFEVAKGGHRVDFSAYELRELEMPGALDQADSLLVAKSRVRCR